MKLLRMIEYEGPEDRVLGVFGKSLLEGKNNFGDLNITLTTIDADFDGNDKLLTSQMVSKIFIELKEKYLKIKQNKKGDG